MARKAMSLSMNYVVIGLVVLIVAFFVSTLFTTNILDFGDIIGSSVDQSTKNFAEEECKIQKNRLCGQAKYADGSCGLTADEDSCWADAATVQEITCRTWIEDHSVLGGELKECDESYSTGLESGGDSGGDSGSDGDGRTPPTFGSEP